MTRQQRRRPGTNPLPDRGGLVGWKWVVWGVVLGVAATTEARPPNIVILIADDLGYADVGFQGCTDIPTPHLDTLARQGVRCTQGYVTHPFCSPTRAGLLTGRYQQRFGHENNPAFLPEDETVGLPLSEKTLADSLQAAGYVTGAVGKWHLGAAPCFHPLERGFDEYFGLLGGGHDYFLHNAFQDSPAAARAEYRIPLQRQRDPVAESEYLTDAISREAVAFIERHQSQPFFLYVAWNAPHTPLQPKPEVLDRVAKIADETRRKYGALVCSLDDGVGRILKQLQDSQLANDTLIFFLSDNGGPIGVTHSNNGVLRGAKGQVLEGGIRVPFVVSWRGKIPAGGSFAYPVSSLDIFPTALAAAAAPPPAAGRLDGHDLLPHLQGIQLQPPHDALFWRTGGGATYAVRKSAYKFVHADGRDQLFDLDRDASELKDLSADRPEVLSLMRKSYEEWNAKLVKPLWQNPTPKKKAAGK